MFRRFASKIVLLPLTVCLAMAGVGQAQSTSSANITVDSTKVIRTVDARIFGLNTATWDSSLNTAATKTLLGATKIGALRFPGGSTSDDYHWKSNTNTSGSTHWATSFDDFASVAQSLNAQVFITINYGSGTAQEAADWVTYSNVTKGYGFKYWEIGNECYGSWENDTHPQQWDPYTYALTVRDYSAAMKAVDPTIKIGVVVVTGEDAYTNNHDHPATNPRTMQVHNGWTPVVLATLKSLGVTPDYVIYHRYEQAPGQETDAGLLQAAATWKNDAANLRQQVNDYLGQNGAGVELVVTENNSVYSNPGKQSTSLVNGLYLADSTGEVLQTELNSLMWWDLRNGPLTNDNNSASLYGWRNYGDYGIMSPQNDLYPTYYVKKLLSNFAGGGEQVVSASTDNQLLAAYSVLGTDATLKLLVVNKDPGNATQAQISIKGFTPTGAATVYSYGIPQDKAARTGKGSPDIAQSTFSGASGAFSFTFPPYSVTVLSLGQGQASTPVISFAQWDGHKNLVISGSSFGSAPKVLVNDKDVSGLIKKASDSSIRIKAKAKALGLTAGSNNIKVVDANGTASNVFVLSL
ncbi:MAG TPA: alpha-L-arabinofuranosidase [Blastocatellia bacterium]|nr:alpha-L-arabinofuranosidase [Blastocatellia bacterium]